MAAQIPHALTVREIVKNEAGSPDGCQGYRIVDSAEGTSREACDAVADLLWVQIHCLSCGARNVRLCELCLATLAAVGDFADWGSFHEVEAVHHRLSHFQDFGEVNPAEVDFSEFGSIIKRMDWPLSGHVLSRHFDGVANCSLSVVIGTNDAKGELRCRHECCLERQDLQALTVACRHCGERTFPICYEHACLVLQVLDQSQPLFPLSCSNTGPHHRIAAIIGMTPWT